MSKPSTGFFRGTSGEQAGKQWEINTHTIDENLPDLIDKYPVTSSGFFGEKGKSSGVRVIESNDPVSASLDFYSRISKNAAIYALPNGKGTKAVFSDGTTVVHRLVTSVPGSPAVDINIKGPGKIRKQKIHFIKRG